MIRFILATVFLKRFSNYNLHTVILKVYPNSEIRGTSGSKLAKRVATLYFIPSRTQRTYYFSCLVLSTILFVFVSHRSYALYFLL